jgi:ergothioneine biosynthesis protein EgtB
VSEGHSSGSARYATIRAQSLAICQPLAIEDYGVQPILDASPPKWHLAHTTWFFEAFLLRPFAASYRPFNEAFEVLFNSYYEGIGPQFPRPMRGTLSRPTVAEVRDYRAHVDQAMQRLLGSEDPEVQTRIELGLHHEQQHQELMLTDIKANLGLNPLRPAYRPDLGADCAARQTPLAFHRIPGGIVEVGAHSSAGGGFRFDNESPRHKVWLDDYALADRLVTNGEYGDFIADGGYDAAELWLSEGWAWLREHAVRAPMYWQRVPDEWREYRLAGDGTLPFGLRGQARTGPAGIGVGHAAHRRRIQRRGFEAEAVDQGFHLRARVAGLGDDQGFRDRRRRNQHGVVGGERGGANRCFRLVEQDRHQGGGVDGDHLGRPRSS